MDKIGGIIIAIGLAAWFCLIFAILVVRLVRRRASLSGMLHERRGGPVRLYRVQSLVITVLFAAIYPVVALWPGHARGMPDIPIAIFLVMAVSHGVFVGGNALSRW